MPLVEYTDEAAETWDRFVFNDSVNGNFLQSRRFLAYHPTGRFHDASLLHYDAKGNLRAVIPAASVAGPRGLEFSSHPGSTYGGIVVDAKTCCAHRMQVLIDELEAFLREKGYSSATLKFPPDFMWLTGGCALAEYLFQLNGWQETCELTTFIDYESYGAKTLSNLSQGKRTNVNNCVKRGFSMKPLDAAGPDIDKLYGLLCENLERHGAKPVHTIDELRALASTTLAGENELLGVFDGDDLIAGGWVFLFANQSVVHTQYLCADTAYSKTSPMTFLYYSIIERYRELGYRALSWGISTEDAGRILNAGLTESKEAFGSTHGVHRRYIKALAE